MAKYRCSTDGGGCGAVFEVADDYYPHKCPECGVVFCGGECCGFYASCVEEDEELGV